MNNIFYFIICSLWREIVLDCIADLEMELTFPPLQKSILRLLQSNKKELARSAAIALLSGGKQARIELFESVKTIPHKKSVMRLIEFIQQGYKKI